MPVHFGNRKIKELYLGGRKIKEAWYDGKKVYSSVGSGVYPWHDRQDYNRGDLVHYQGLVYECIQDHQADGSKTKPGEGWDQYSYWKQVGYVRERNDIKYDPWNNGKYYYSGEIVSATVNGWKVTISAPVATLRVLTIDRAVSREISIGSSSPSPVVPRPPLRRRLAGPRLATHRPALRPRGAPV